MSEDHAVSNDPVDMDYAEHEKTYRLFMTLLKAMVIVPVVILIVMAFTLL